MIAKRIDYELDHRIVEPYLSHNFTWMTWDNNWNPWINTNVLRVVLMTTSDEKKRNDIIVKAIRSVDYFLNNYPNDGGCDEGPGYWNTAGGKLIEFIDLLNSVSNGRMNWSTNQLIHNMGSYISKIYIGNARFVNFADAPAIILMDTSRIMRYGVTFKDEKLRQFAAHLQTLYEWINNKDALTIALENVPDLRVFGQIETISLMKNTTAAPLLMAQSWLPELQVSTMRAIEGSINGLFFGVKGGTNGNKSYNSTLNKSFS